MDECRWCRGTGKLKLLTSVVECDCRRRGGKTTAEEKDCIITKLLGTPGGKRMLAEAMHEPKRGAFDYRGIFRVIAGAEAWNPSG